MLKEDKVLSKDSSSLMIDWNVIVIVEPALWGIEETSLVTFEYKGNKIKFKENKGNRNNAIDCIFKNGGEAEIKKPNNETKLSIQLKSKEENLLTEIDALMSHFLGRFELDGTRFYCYKLGQVINLKTGLASVHIKFNINKPIDTEYEKYITRIDNIAASSNEDIITNSFIAFHYAKMAISLQHSYLSMTNAFYYLIQDVGRQERTLLSGVNAIWILFYEKIIKNKEDKTNWDNNLKWIHDTIDDIRYKNKKVTEKDVEKVQNLYKKFLDMYIIYKQQRE